MTWTQINTERWRRVDGALVRWDQSSPHILPWLPGTRQYIAFGPGPEEFNYLAQTSKHGLRWPRRWKTAAQHDSPGTLVYADPPYVHSTRSKAHNSTKRNYRHEMNDEDHAELAQVLATIKGMAVISGYRCDLYDALYAGWRRVERQAFADGARKRTEVLWISPNADERTAPLFRREAAS